MTEGTQPQEVFEKAQESAEVSETRAELNKATFEAPAKVEDLNVQDAEKVQEEFTALVDSAASQERQAPSTVPIDQVDPGTQVVETDADLMKGGSRSPSQAAISQDSELEDGTPEQADSPPAEEESSETSDQAEEAAMESADQELMEIMPEITTHQDQGSGKEGAARPDSTGSSPPVEGTSAGPTVSPVQEASGAVHLTSEEDFSVEMTGAQPGEVRGFAPKEDGSQTYKLKGDGQTGAQTIEERIDSMESFQETIPDSSKVVPLQEDKETVPLEENETIESLLDHSGKILVEAAVPIRGEDSPRSQAANDPNLYLGGPPRTGGLEDADEIPGEGSADTETDADTDDGSGGDSDSPTPPPPPPETGTGVSPNLPGIGTAGRDSTGPETSAVELEFAETVENFSTAGMPADVNALIQYVLREAYMENTKDLGFYAQKVRFFNKMKENIRDHLTALKDSSTPSLVGNNVVIPLTSSEAAESQSGAAGTVNVSLDQDEFNILAEIVEDEDRAAGTAVAELETSLESDTFAGVQDADSLMDISFEGSLSEFLKLDIQDPSSEVPDLSKIDAVDAVEIDQKQIENYKETLAVLKDDLSQLQYLLKEYQALPGGGQYMEVFTLHVPVKTADGTYQLMPMPLPLSSASIQTTIPVLQIQILQIQIELSQLEGPSGDD